MKNFFKKSLYLTAFIVAGIVFQISCSNSDDQIFPNNTPPAVGKIIYVKRIASAQSIWVCNTDGSNQTQIPITLPANVTFYGRMGSADYTTARLSPDGQTITFTVIVIPGFLSSIYACNIDGSNVHEVVPIEADTAVYIGNVI